MSDAQTSALADQIVRLNRTLRAWRAAHADPRKNPEGAAHLLLLAIEATGPMRASALAEATHSDPSTISRHVSLLLRQRLVRRQADPGDGRASLLALTAAGRRRVQQMRDNRDSKLAEVLGDWTDDDVQTLGRLLHRFNDSLEGTLTGVSAEQETA